MEILIEFLNFHSIGPVIAVIFGIVCYAKRLKYSDDLVAYSRLGLKQMIVGAQLTIFVGAAVLTAPTSFSPSKLPLAYNSEILDTILVKLHITIANVAVMSVISLWFLVSAFVFLKKTDT